MASSDDVYDARMDRMEMLLEKTMAEIRNENEKFRSEFKTEIRVLDERINGVEKQIADLQTSVYWDLASLLL